MGSFGAAGPVALSPPQLPYTNLGATGTADHLTLLRPLLFWAAAPNGQCLVGHTGDYLDAIC